MYFGGDHFSGGEGRKIWLFDENIDPRPSWPLGRRWILGKNKKLVVHGNTAVAVQRKLWATTATLAADQQSDVNKHSRKLLTSRSLWIANNLPHVQYWESPMKEKGKRGEGVRNRKSKKMNGQVEGKIWVFKNNCWNRQGVLYTGSDYREPDEPGACCGPPRSDCPRPLRTAASPPPPSGPPAFCAEKTINR